MIKLVIFDLDGVLVDTRDIHYHALNGALIKFAPECWINYDEHLTKYDGLPTTKKLIKLTQDKGLSDELYSIIWREKQNQTAKVIQEFIQPDDHKDIIDILQSLKEDGYPIYCASNSIGSTMNLMVECAGLIDFIDYNWSNERVNNPKPHSEIYLRCMIQAGVNPKETLIIEDSHIGRKAAHESGAHVLGVKDRYDVTKDKIYRAISQANQEEPEIKPKWQGGNMNVLIPMAGAGSRFEKAGYTFPKPLIEVRGKPMIQTVVENLNIDARHIFIVQKEHYEKYNLQTVLSLISPNCEIVQVDGVTEGAACTTLLAKDFINNDEPLLIANSDQFIKWDSNEFLYAVSNANIDGGILTFESVHPKWSFAKTDSGGYVTEVAEKNPISNHATVGVYYWKHGSDYVRYAEEMIQKDKRVNNEFYVCPVFNEAIADGKKYRLFPIEKMWGLGTPEDLETFLNETDLT